MKSEIPEDRKPIRITRTMLESLGYRQVLILMAHRALMAALAERPGGLLQWSPVKLSKRCPMATRKDLRDLQNLPRSPALSYLQKQARPPRPRSAAEKQAPPRYPLLAS